MQNAATSSPPIPPRAHPPGDAVLRAPFWLPGSISCALHLGETRQESKGQERNAAIYLYRRALRTTCIWEPFETTELAPPSCSTSLVATLLRAHTQHPRRCTKACFGGGESLQRSQTTRPRALGEQTAPPCIAPGVGHPACGCWLSHAEPCPMPG